MNIVPSIEMIPAKYSDGILLCQEPMDGSGDLSVTRATTVSTRFNAAGFIETVTSGLPRLDYYTSDGTPGCPALLVEAEATNLLQRSEDFANGYWAKSYGVVTFGTTISPDGTNDATTYVIDTGVGIDSAIERTFLSLATGTTHTLSLFVKKKDYDTASIRFYTDETPTFICSFNLSTATVTGGTIQNYGNGWYRVSVSGTTAATVTNPKVELIRAAQIRNSVAGIYIWGAQFETGRIATSYIPTVASTVTRDADVINKTAISGLIGQAEGTVYLEVDALFSGASDLFCFARATANTISISKNSSNRIQATVYTSGPSSALNIAASSTVSGNMKIAFAYKSGSSALYINGVQIGTSATAFSFTAALTQININPTGFFEGPGNQRLNALAIYKIVLSNPELASLTT
jgi:hypothetical protein